MKFLHYITEWKHLKLKNIILNEENENLVGENRLLVLQNRAFGIENFDAGRRIARLKSDQEALIDAYNQLKGNLVTGHQLIDGQPPEIDEIVGNLDDTPGIIAIDGHSRKPKTSDPK